MSSTQSIFTQPLESLSPAGQLLGSLARSTTTKSSRHYWLVFLFLIPVVLIALALLFVCCIGRSCQLFLYKTFNCVPCKCLRPDDKLAYDKQYDATICYSEHDERWLDEEFMPQFAHFDRGYRLHKMGLYSRFDAGLSKEREHILRSSKRVLLIFSSKFLKEEWRNKYLRYLLNEICLGDPNCIIICINSGELNENRLKKVTSQLQASISKNIISDSKENSIRRLDYDDDVDITVDNNISTLKRLKATLKHALGLNNVENLNWCDKKFWYKLNYMMPFEKCTDTRPTTITSRPARLPRLPARRASIESDSKASQSTSSSNETRLLSKKLRDEQKKSKYYKRSRTIPVSNVEQLTSSDFSSDRMRNSSELSSLSTNTSANVRSLRHVVVPMPDFMRTQLGYKRSNEEQEEQEASGEQTKKSNYKLNEKTKAITTLEEGVYYSMSVSNASADSNNSKSSSFVSQRAQLECKLDMLNQQVRRRAELTAKTNEQALIANNKEEKTNASGGAAASNSNKLFALNQTATAAEKSTSSTMMTNTIDENSDESKQKRRRKKEKKHRRKRVTEQATNCAASASVCSISGHFSQADSNYKNTNNNKFIFNNADADIPYEIDA
jgi:hypothetical protein